MFKRKTTNKSNPFIDPSSGKAQWNDRYMKQSIRIKNLQLLIVFLLGVIAVLSFTVSRIALSSKVVPYVVELNNGIPVNVQKLTTSSTPRNLLFVNYAVNKFIISARTLTLDHAINKSNLDFVYSFATDKAIPFLDNFFNTNGYINPTKKVYVNIISSLQDPATPNLWQISWEESSYSANGEFMGKAKYEALIHYTFGKPDVSNLSDNPFGIYFTDLTWSSHAESST